MTYEKLKLLAGFIIWLNASQKREEWANKNAWNTDEAFHIKKYVTKYDKLVEIGYEMMDFPKLMNQGLIRKSEDNEDYRVRLLEHLASEFNFVKEIMKD